MKKIVFLYIFMQLCLFFIVAGCASQKKDSNTLTHLYSLERKMLVRADSLFKAEKYELAVQMYRKIRDEYSNKPAGAFAQYKIGYIEIYFGNPFANYHAALREFTRFQENYPDHQKIDEVRNWIRILTVLEEFNQEYKSGRKRLKNYQEENQTYTQTAEEVEKKYRDCIMTKDSLIQHVEKLKGVIEYLEEMK